MKEVPENQIICIRCGNCCIDVGRTFWKAGNILCDGKPFGDIEALNKLAMNGDHEDGDKPCEMLRFQDDEAVCQIQENWGYEAKPEVCRDHEGDKRCSKIPLFRSNDGKDS